MVPADRQFVLSGWSSSFRKSRYAGLISNARWAEVMHREIGAILDAKDTSVIVACEPGELDHEGREFLYGFIATRKTGAPYVYYVYVKLAYRLAAHPERPYRIGRRLFAAAGVDPAEPFTFAPPTAIAEQILATCRHCGRRRSEHGEHDPCEFTPKFAGSFDPVPAREAA
jgi:hypothetical protein